MRGIGIVDDKEQLSSRISEGNVDAAIYIAVTGVMRRVFDNLIFVSCAKRNILIHE